MAVDVRHDPIPARQGAPDGEWSRPERDRGEVQLGTVGWDDAADSVDPGTATNDGNTLIRVTLYQGRDPNETLDPTRAQGTKILARNSGGEVIPQNGSQVVVVRPAGIDGPGCWHVVCNPGAVFGPVLPADGGTFIRRGRDGTVSIGTTTDGTKDGQLIYFQIKRDGFVFLAPWGKITFDQGGLHALHHSGARLDLGGLGGLPAPLDTMSSYAQLGASIMRFNGAAITLGPDAGVFEQVAKALSTLTLFGAFQTQLGLIQAALVGLDAALTPPGGASVPVAAAAAGLVTLGTAVTAAAVAIPSQAAGAS